MSTSDHNIPHDYEDDDAEFFSDYDFDEEDDCEPVGSCDECDENLYHDDWYEVRGMMLCSWCAWIASGCPEPGKRRKG